MHAVWSRRTNERLAALGFEFLTAYVAGRAADLGEPDPGVVVSSFAVFEPEMLTATFEQARATCDRATMLAARTEATIESLTETLAGVPLDEVTDIADRLAAAVTAADVAGRPLFAGLANQPWPHDPVGRLWRACDLVREHRGDSHVAASVAAGVGPIAMNVLTELWVGMPLGSYSATRGWTPEQITATADRLRGDGLLEDDHQAAQAELSRRGQVWRDGLEATTDAQERSIVEALGDGFDGVVARLDAWSARCVAAGAFPPDVFKRAAG